LKYSTSVARPGRAWSGSATPTTTTSPFCLRNQLLQTLPLCQHRQATDRSKWQGRTISGLLLLLVVVLLLLLLLLLLLVMVMVMVVVVVVMMMMMKMMMTTAMTTTTMLLLLMLMLMRLNQLLCHLHQLLRPSPRRLQLRPPPPQFA
jgi:hypothetical protein